MKHSIDTYRLYSSEKIFSFCIRVRVTMKDEVDIEVLRKSINTAMRRYPYFAKEVVLGEDGGYDLIPNKRDVVVLETREKLPNLCSEEVNRHLLYLDCKGRDIFFNISHSMCGGKGMMPWLQTTLYQYVADKYGITPDAPGIRKPDSELLPGETDEPTLDMLINEEPIYTYKSKKPVVMLLDYLNGMYNPFKRDPIYYQFTFEQSDIMVFARNNDSSVAAFFLMTLAMALNKVLPEKYKVIGGETAHFPGADIGLPNSYHDLLSHVHIDYDRKFFDYDVEKLGTYTRSQIILQADPTVSNYQLRKHFSFLEEIDKISGQKNKIAAYAKTDPSKGKEAQHGTFISNYTGRADFGEVADYIESYFAMVDGHLLLETLSMSDKIFISFMQLIRDTKYVNAFCEVMDELGISYKMEGPFPNIRPKHQLPQE